MAGRYSQYRQLDYCFSPRLVHPNEETEVLVPCGKCEGCRLHAANVWSQRVSLEIDNNPYSVFFTLTYNNIYIPKLIEISDGIYTSCHPANIRFNSVKNVCRDDDIFIRSSAHQSIKIEHSDFVGIPYLSKRDIQLFLKLVRKNLQLHGITSKIRYYIIGEYGPTTYRPHYHGIFFCPSLESSEILVNKCMYASWQMCDAGLFRDYISYCDSGTSQYVSNYVTSTANIPSILRQDAIKQFRLCSKSPAIGYQSFCKEEIYESIVDGDMSYERTFKSVESQHIFRYPSAYTSALFPKCYRFSTLSFNGLLDVYGKLYQRVHERRFPLVVLSSGLYKELHSADYIAALKCYRFCVENGCTPFHYVYLVDLLHYRLAMQSLKLWYEWQELNMSNPVKVLSSYNNLIEYVNNLYDDYRHYVADMFFSSFNVDYSTLTIDELKSISNYYDSSRINYQHDVLDIMRSLHKTKKYNELSGVKPHSV